MLIETHVLEVKSPNKPTEYLGFESEEAAKGAAFDALQNGVFSYTDYNYSEETVVSQEISVPPGTLFRVVSRDTFIVESRFRGY